MFDVPSTKTWMFSCEGEVLYALAYEETTFPSEEKGLIIPHTIACTTLHHKGIDRVQRSVPMSSARVSMVRCFSEGEIA